MVFGLSMPSNERLAALSVDNSLPSTGGLGGLLAGLQAAGAGRVMEEDRARAFEQQKFDNDLATRKLDISENPITAMKDRGATGKYLQDVDVLASSNVITADQATELKRQRAIADAKGVGYYGDKSYATAHGKGQGTIPTAQEIERQKYIGREGLVQSPTGELTPLVGSELDREYKGEVSKANDSADYMLETIDSILTDEDGIDASIGGIFGMKGRQSSAFPLGAEQRDFQPKVDKLKGQVFMEAYQTLKGGGQITEVEGRKAEQAMAKLNQSQSPEAFKEGLIEMKQIVENSRNRVQEQYGNTTEPSGYEEMSDEEFIRSLK